MGTVLMILQEVMLLKDHHLQQERTVLYKNLLMLLVSSKNMQ